MARGMHKYKEPLTEQLTEERATFQFLEAEYGNYTLTKMAFLVMITRLVTKALSTKLLLQKFCYKTLE